jgi:hypothetical protein
MRFVCIVVALLCGIDLADAASQRLKGEFCACGYNSRQICDGSYIHYISDCYDETGTYCGYDDQTDGPCDANLKRLRRVPSYSRPQPKLRN